MIFRAVTIQGKLYYFNIADAPVSINDKYSIFNFSGRKDALRRLEFYVVQIDSIYQKNDYNRK